MGFRFTLASVLRLRESIEQREELALQRIQFELARTRRSLDDAETQIESRSRSRDESLAKAIPAYQLQDLENGIEEAKATRLVLLDALGKLFEERDRQMKIYQAARSGRQMLTDLRAQKRSEWEQEQVRVQQKQLDDIFAARMQRK